MIKRYVIDAGSELSKSIENGLNVHSVRVGRGTLLCYTEGEKKQGTRVIQASSWGWKSGDIKDAGSVEDEAELFCLTSESYAKDLGYFNDRGDVPETPQGIASMMLKQYLKANGIPGHTEESVHDWRAIRAAYRGGYSAVIRTWADVPVTKIDMNSAYPAEMLNPLPAVFVESESSLDFGPLSLVRATVEAPDMILPVLPSRTWTGSVAYPTGYRTDTWTGEELIYAVSRGYKIMEVLQVWNPTREIDLSEIILGLLKARKEIPAPYNKWAKIAVNSIAGMLGKREYTPIYKIGEIPPGWKAAAQEQTGGIDIGTRDLFTVSPYSHPGTAAFVTARTRIQLLEVCRIIGESDCYYIDTDSIAFAAWRLKSIEHLIGGNAGQWKLEHLAAEGYSCENLRKIKWDRIELPENNSGRYLCGRITAGTWTVPQTIRDLCLAERETTTNDQKA